MALLGLALLSAASSRAQGGLPSPNLGTNTQINGVPLSQIYLSKSGGAVSGLVTLGSGDTNTSHNGFTLPGSPVTSDPSTAVPSIVHQYSGQNVTLALVRDAVASSATLAEQTGAFRMYSNTGLSAGVSAYKMAMGAESACGSGSAPCWGATTVLTTLSGYPLANVQITHEFDQNNNSGSNCTDGDFGVAGVVPCGTLLITGAGSNQVTFGLGIGGNNQVRNGVQFAKGGPIAADLRSYSGAVSVLSDTGIHTYGLALNGTYSGAVIAGSGFSLAQGGAFTAASLTTGGQTTALYLKLTPVSYATLVAQKPCNATNQGLHAFLNDSPSVTFNAAVTTGGGSNAIGVTCNGANYVVGG